MKKNHLKLEGKVMLTKDEMKNIGGGGDNYCNYTINPCWSPYQTPQCDVWTCYIDYWHYCDTPNTAIVYSWGDPYVNLPSVYPQPCSLYY